MPIYLSGVRRTAAAIYFSYASADHNRTGLRREEKQISGREGDRKIERDPFYCNDVVINFPPFRFTAPADGLTDGRKEGGTT